MGVSMDGWKDGWINECIDDGWMGWDEINGSIDEFTYRCTLDIFCLSFE